jgi:hypothetical protein
VRASATQGADRAAPWAGARSAVLSRLSVKDVVLAARLNALGDVWIDRLGSLGSVFLHVRSRNENGGRPWLVFEAERPNSFPCEGGERRADQRPDQKQGQRELKSDHESYQVQRPRNQSVSPGYGNAA